MIHIQAMLCIISHEIMIQGCFEQELDDSSRHDSTLPRRVKSSKRAYPAKHVTILAEICSKSDALPKKVKVLEKVRMNPPSYILLPMVLHTSINI
jgi:hypothetical protein